MSNEEKEIAEKSEILRFYTSIMRGKDSNATVANKLSAAEKLTAQLDADSTVTSAMERLDSLLSEFRQAVAEGGIVADDGEEYEGDEIESFDADVDEFGEELDDDEDQQ